MVTTEGKHLKKGGKQESSAEPSGQRRQSNLCYRFCLLNDINEIVQSHGVELLK